MFDENDNIKKAIQLAEQERDSLLVTLTEYEKVKSRVSQLEVFINTGKNLLGTDGAISKNESTTLFPDENLHPVTHEEGVKKILTDAGRALSLSDLVVEYSKRNWKLSEKNGREVLRGVIWRKKDIFKKKMVGNKTYISLIPLRIEASASSKTGLTQ